MNQKIEKLIELFEMYIERHMHDNNSDNYILYELRKLKDGIKEE